MKTINDTDKQKIINFIKNHFSIKSDISIVLKFNGTTAYLDIAQMYKFIPINFESMLFLSELFGSKKIDVEERSYNGCETCDYGSRYEKNLIIQDVNIDTIIKNITVVTVLSS